MTISNLTLQKDIELCRYTIILIQEQRLESWNPTIFKNNLCSDERTRNIIGSLGVDRLGRDEVISLLNILEVIEEDEGDSERKSL